MAKNKKEHWSYKALGERLKERTKVIEHQQLVYDDEPVILKTYERADWEYGTVFLIDPDFKEEIDKSFFEVLYPLSLYAFKDEKKYRIPNPEQIKLVDNREDIEASRKARFLATDANRPIASPNSPLWYVRFTVEIKVLGYMLHTDLHLDLPYSINSDWVIDLMKQSANWSNPASLSFNRNGLTLIFSWGEGKSFVLPEEWENHFSTPFTKHIRILKAVDRFEKNPANKFLLSNMIQEITSMYNDY